MKRTGLLLLQRQVVPVGLHAVAQRHPQLRLLLRRHRFPPLLDPGKRRVRDGVRLTVLRSRPGSVQTGGWGGEDGRKQPPGCGRGQEGGGAVASYSGQRAQHLGGIWPRKAEMRD